MVVAHGVSREATVALGMALGLMTVRAGRPQLTVRGCEEQWIVLLLQTALTMKQQQEARRAWERRSR